MRFSCPGGRCPNPGGPGFENVPDFGRGLGGSELFPSLPDQAPPPGGDQSPEDESGGNGMLVGLGGSVWFWVALAIGLALLFISGLLVVGLMLILAWRCIGRPEGRMDF